MPGLIFLYRHIPLQYRCVSVLWWSAAAPGHGTEPEPCGNQPSSCGRGTVPYTRSVPSTKTRFGHSLVKYYAYRVESKTASVYGYLAGHDKERQGHDKEFSSDSCFVVARV